MAYHRPFSARMSTLVVIVGVFYVLLSVTIHSASTPTSPSTQTATTTMATTTRPEIKYNQSCNVSVDKCIADLICIKKICDCNITGYYDGNTSTGYLCKAKQSNGSYCTNTRECSADLTCNANKCSCDDAEYYNGINPTDLCHSKLNHSETCDANSGTDVCKETNTSCIYYQPPSSTTRCLCNKGFYRSDNNTCVPMSKLTINLNEKIQDRNTTYIVFSWTDNSARSNVIYTILSNGFNFTANKTGGTVINLRPGTQHSFLITLTLPGDASYPSFKGESNYSLWTFPAKPGHVDKVTFDSSSASPPFVYEIIFNASDGNVVYYQINVTGNVSTSNKTNSTRVKLSLTPATQYNYIIKSVNGNGDESEPMTSSFTTPATASGPVGNLTTTVILDSKADIKWQEPLNKNGNITGYLIQVKQETGDGKCLYNIKLKCNNCTPQSFDVNDTDCTSTEPANNTYDSAGYYNLELPKLEPYHNYTVVVRAVNEKGLGQKSEISFRTAERAANSVSDLLLTSARDENTNWVNLNINWTSGKFTGPTTYYILVQEETGLDSNEYTSGTPYTVSEYNNTTFVKKNVLAFWNYNISVTAGTSKGNSTMTVKQVKTVQNTPGTVKNLTVNQDLNIAKNLAITFLYPEEKSRNGTILRFEISQNINTDNKTDQVNIYSVDATTACKMENCSFSDVKNITVEHNYTFAVKTVNDFTGGKFGRDFQIYIYPRVPLPKDKEDIQKLVTKSATNGAEETRVTVDVCTKCLTDESQGKITDIGLIIDPCVKGQKCLNPGRKRRSTIDSEYRYPTWSKAKVNDFKIKYRTTPDDWIIALKNVGESDKLSFTIGENQSCATFPETVFCNGPLPAGKQFKITVVICTGAGCGSYTSDEVFESLQDSEPTGAIIGGVLGGLAFIIIICIIVYLIWRFRRRHRKTTRSTSASVVMNEIRVKRPVKMRNFNDHCAKFHKDSNLLFQDEFESIQTLSKSFTFSSEQAKLEQNRVKNRYVDIIPYDHSRVKLDTLPDDDETKDFINANYIPGYNSVREYIATQGPMYSTMPDFWRMVWEQKCKVIVMLSDLMESGKRKVDLYWPENLNEPITYEHVVVEMTNFSQLNNSIIRNFKVTKGGEVRKITHFFLPGWSDFSADVGIEVVLSFAKLARLEATPANPGPIVVHCSAGVGRTGTLIALDYFTQFVEKHSLDDEIDVYDFVVQMRKNRCRMVQVESQYIFIYDAINKIIQQKIKAEEENLYENSSSNGIYNNVGQQQEENIYQNTNVKEDKYVYNNEAFEADYSNISSSKKSEKPTTEL